MAGRDNERLTDWLKQSAHMLRFSNDIGGKAKASFSCKTYTCATSLPALAH